MTVKKSILKMLMLMLAAGLLAGCGQQTPERATLERVEAQMAADPKASLLALDSIDREGLAEPDQMLYDLLRVKASDKAYIRHTNEKKILDVVDYYARSGDRERHAESLFYAGRVFKSHGDIPTALQYYQQALDITPEKPEDSSLKEFKSRLLYHIGSLMQSIRMYDQAASYLKQAQGILEQSGDSLRLMYNLELQASVFVHTDSLDKAQKLLERSLGIAYKFTEQDVAIQRMFLAGVYYKRGMFDSALNMVRGVPERVSKDVYSTALGYASDIYLANGMKDTAYMYAHMLCRLDSTKNQKHGFQNILTTDLVRFLPADSLLWYVKKYSDVMEDFVSSNADETALMQDSSFNYDIHDRKRAKAEHRVRILSWSVAGALLLVFILIIVILQQRVKNKDRELRIQKAVSEILAGRVKSEDEQKDAVAVDDIVDAEDVCQSFRNKLREDLIRREGEIAPSQTLLDSELYKTLEKRLESNRSIPEKSPVWAKIEQVILEEAPDFKNSLTILSDGKLNSIQYNLAMLIRIGMSPSQCAQLMSIAKSSMSYRRQRLAAKILGAESEHVILDSVIYLL